MEDAFEEHLPELLQPFGMNLLVLGRQVLLRSGRRIDLLAVDDAGTLWIVELKVGLAKPSVVAQVLDYGSQLVASNWASLSALAVAGSGYTPAALYHQHFGTAPPRLRAEPRMLIIAGSFDRSVLTSLGALTATHLDVIALNYSVRHGRVRVANVETERTEGERSSIAGVALQRLRRAPTQRQAPRRPTPPAPTFAISGIVMRILSCLP